jgi:putative salt-induced outer membrane protein YdiY
MRPLSPIGFSLLLALGFAATAGATPTSVAKPFETTLSFNGLLTSGNASKGEIGSKLETQGATTHFEQIRAGGSYSYGQSEVDAVKTTTAKRWDLFGNVRRPWELDETYTFLNGKIESDAVADLHYRVTEGGGVGLYLKKAEKVEWSVESGLSWVWEETADGSANYPAIRLGERYERKWEGGPKVTQNLEILPHALRINDFLLNADVQLETVITQSLNLRTAMEYHYQSRTPDETKSYDLRLVVGVSCKF